MKNFSQIYYACYVEYFKISLTLLVRLKISHNYWLNLRQTERYVQKFEQLQFIISTNHLINNKFLILIHFLCILVTSIYIFRPVTNFTNIIFHCNVNVLFITIYITYYYLLLLLFISV